jgi:hypothetical protein
MSITCITKEDFNRTLDLLKRAANYFTDDAPDANWFKDLYLLTGKHMVLTGEGWCEGECKASLLKDYPNEKYEDIILDEVNAPEVTVG